MPDSWSKLLKYRRLWLATKFLPHTGDVNISTAKTTPCRYHSAFLLVIGLTPMSTRRGVWSFHTQLKRRGARKSKLNIPMREVKTFLGQWP